MCCGGLGDRHGDSEDGVGAEVALVGGSVELVHLLVKGTLLGDVLAGEGLVQGRVHSVDGL